MEKEYISVSHELASNIMLARNDNEFITIEKAEVADAIFGIKTAQSITDDKRTKERLESAMNVLMSYMFYIDLFKE